MFDYCEKRKGKKKVIAQTVVPLYLFRVQEFVKSKEGREIMNNMKMKWEDFFFLICDIEVLIVVVSNLWIVKCFFKGSLLSFLVNNFQYSFLLM